MRKLAVFLITVLLVVALYAGVTLLTFRSYFHLPLYIAIVVATILAVVLALVGFLLRKPIQVFVDQVFYRETYEYRQTLLNFSSRMGNILNPEQLAQEMLLTLSKAFRISRVLLLLEDRGSGYFTSKFVYPKPKDKPDNELRLLLGSPIVLWLQKASHPLNVAQMGSIVEFKGMDSVERGVLGNLELICPLKSHGKLIGILCVGKKQYNKLYSQEDLEVIVSTVNQAGVILENAMLFHDIIREADELKASNEKLLRLINPETIPFPKS
jgi:K+-sensing histidine kinase KdpD